MLTEQSRGGLHVFLPLADRGVDALVHRMSDGVYFQVQAKSRSTLQDGEVHFVVWPETLVHDEVLIVAGLVVEGGLGPTLLVAPAADFRRLADLTSDQGKPIYSAEFGMRPRSDTRGGCRGSFRSNDWESASELHLDVWRKLSRSFALSGGVTWVL